LALAYVFVAARVYTRLFRLREKMNWADWLLIASALDALGLIICDTLTYQMGVLDDYEESVKLKKVSFLFLHSTSRSVSLDAKPCGFVVQFKNRTCILTIIDLICF
jgi:hypothetical protein